jgi:hypothetical protein
MFDVAPSWATSPASDVGAIIGHIAGQPPPTRNRSVSI